MQCNSWPLQNIATIDVNFRTILTQLRRKGDKLLLMLLHQVQHDRSIYEIHKQSEHSDITDIFPSCHTFGGDETTPLPEWESMSPHIPYIQQMYTIIWLFFIKLYTSNIEHARDHMFLLHSSCRLVTNFAKTQLSMS